MSRIYERLVLKHQCDFLRTPFFTEHLQWLLLTVSVFQPAASLKKGLEQRHFSVNFAKIFKNTFLQNTFLQNTSGSLLLVFTCNFEKFFRSPILQSTSGKLLISCTSCKISNTRYNKKYFTSAFQALSTNTRRSYLEAFIYLKSLKIIFE